MVAFAVATETATATAGGKILMIVDVETGERHEFVLTTTAATTLKDALTGAGA
jgi:hypothetical protein